MVNTRVHVPDACGQPLSAGDFVFDGFVLRQPRINWLTVGKTTLLYNVVGIKNEIAATPTRGEELYQVIPRVRKFLCTTPVIPDACFACAGRTSVLVYHYSICLATIPAYVITVGPTHVLPGRLPRLDGLKMSGNSTCHEGQPLSSFRNVLQTFLWYIQNALLNMVNTLQR